MKISLQPIEKVFAAEIQGTKPLLMHNPMTTRPLQDQYEAGKIPSKVEAEAGLYKDPLGNIVIPSINVLSMMFYAGSDLTVGSKGKTRYKKFVKSGLEIEPFDVPLINYTPWTVDIRPAKIGKAQIMRSRPRFDQWGLKFQIKVVDSIFLDSEGGPDILKALLSLGGRRYCLGDNRPLFGQFKLLDIKEVSE